MIKKLITYLSASVVTAIIGADLYKIKPAVSYTVTDLDC